MVSLPEGIRILKIYQFVPTESTNVTDGRTDGRTDGQTPRDGISRAYMHFIARQKNRDFQLLALFLDFLVKHIAVVNPCDRRKLLITLTAGVRL